MRQFLIPGTVSGSAILKQRAVHSKAAPEPDRRDAEGTVQLSHSASEKKRDGSNGCRTAGDFRHARLPALDTPTHGEDFAYAT
jgi:hypothetical protein